MAGAWPCGARGPANQLICITVTFSYENLAEVDAEWVRQIKRPVGGSVSGTWRCPEAAFFWVFFFLLLIQQIVNGYYSIWTLFANILNR